MVYLSRGLSALGYPELEKGRMRTDLEQPVGEEKPYVQSDVIKAKNYLFSLCIHGEIVSTGRKKCIMNAHFRSGAFQAVSRRF